MIRVLAFRRGIIGELGAFLKIRADDCFGMKADVLGCERYPMFETSETARVPPAGTQQRSIGVRRATLPIEAYHIAGRGIMVFAGFD